MLRNPWQRRTFGGTEGEWEFAGKELSPPEMSEVTAASEEKRMAVLFQLAYSGCAEDLGSTPPLLHFTTSSPDVLLPPGNDPNMHEAPGGMGKKGERLPPG